MISAIEILALHDRLIEETGGSFGVRDEGGLLSAIGRPFHTFGGEDLHPTPFAKAAALLEALAINHPFVDGNKRIAIASAALLLHREGIELTLPTDEATEFMLAVAEGRHDVASIVRQLEAWQAG